MTETPNMRLRRAREAKWSTVPEAADALGLKASTLRSHENGSRAITFRAAQQYSRLFGLPLSDLLELSSEITSTTEVDVVGEAGVGVWREERAEGHAVKGRRIETLPVPKNKAKIGTRQAVKIIDESANLYVGAGEFAVFELSDDDPLPGWVVVVDRTRGGLTERSIRRVVRKPGGLFLQSPTRDKKLFSELPYNPSHPDETVVIVGRVVGKFVSFDD